MACLLAQSGSIRGKIITDKNEPLANANIIISGTQEGTSSMSDGVFEIKNVPYGAHVLEISLIGYSRRTVPVTLNANTKPVIIILSEEIIQSRQIVVSASKYEQKVQDLPVSASILSAENISGKNYITFDEVLRFVPGIQMNLEQVSIRGSNGYSKGVGARVLVAVNGIPLYSGDTGDIVWELIPVTDVERVEIIKGPASSLYGSTAIGGVINIITRAASKNPVTYFRSYLGAYDNPAYDIWKWNDNLRTFYGAEVTHSNSSGKLGYTFSFKKLDDLGYLQNSFAKRNLGYIKLNYDFTPQNHLTFFADFLNMNRGNFLYWKDSRNALIPPDDQNGNTVKSNRLFAGLIYHHYLNDNVYAELKSSYYHTKFDGYGVELTESVADLFRNELSANMILSDAAVLTSGIELSNSSISSIKLFGSSKFFGVGAYSQIEFKGISKLIATLGLRWDYMKLDTIKSANAVTPRIGLNYKASEDLIFRASFGTGFRAPTPAEVFASTAISSGISVKENPNLKAEVSASVEAGAIYNYSKDLSFDLALYQTDYNDFIEANLVDGTTIQFINLSRARIQGIEFTANWSPIPSLLKFTAGYNYMWARDLEKNIAMKYRPLNSVTAQARFSPYPFDFGIDFRYSGRVEEIDDLFSRLVVPDGDKRVPIYVTDLSAGYNFLLGSAPAKVYLNAKNIFNYNYVEFMGNIAPIRNYSVSLELFF